MKIIVFLIALMLFGFGVYFFIVGKLDHAVVFLLTEIAFLYLIDHDPGK